MAKFTKKIRIAEYDVLNNQFILTFQLAGYANQLSFEAYVDEHSTVNIDGDSDDILVEFGFSNGDIGQMIDELADWVGKPRKSLGGNSHMYTMRSRFEVAERLEQERRGKAEAERIMAEAPPLDWAMSVTEELVDESVEKRRTEIGVIYNDPKVQDAFRQLNEGRSTPTESFDNVATKGRIAAVEAAGLGEESATVDRVQTTRDAEEAKYQYRRKIADARTEQAVNAIRAHARRFLTPMSLREHDFLRAVIREEIDKVVEGVL